MKLKLLPLQVIITVLPLVLYLYVGNSGYAEYPWNSFDDEYLDIFLHGKMVLFLILSAVLLLLTVYKLTKLDKQERRKSLGKFIPLFVYIGFVLLSTVCSKNISYSFFGSMDAKEPVTVLLGYVIAALYGYLVIESVNDVTQLIASAVLGSGCMAVLGVLQAVGKDPLLKEGVQRLFVSGEFIEERGFLQLTFSEGMAYGTLFNPNYVGTYVAMYVPLLLLGVVIYRQIWKKTACGIICLGLFVMLFASQSRTGLISVGAVAVMLLLFLGRKIWKRWYFIVPGMILVLIAFWLIDAQRDFLLINRLKEIVSIRPSEEPVQGVDTTGNGVRVLYKDTEFTVRMPVSGNEFVYAAFEGEEQKQVTYNSDKTFGYFTLNNGEQIAIQTAIYENRYAFGLEINGRNFYFTNQGAAGNYKYINELGRLDECVSPANVFPGYEAAASGRGYVWGRTIPLLANHVFLGSGPDTFAVEFPQNDYVARYRSSFDNIIFTRPHNLYLQMGIQTGVLSLIAFLVFYVRYFVDSCKKYGFRDYRTLEEQIGFALFLSTVGFMAAGLANDSLIVVTPVFYVLVGTGMAVNQKICKAIKNSENKKEEGK